MGNSRKILAIAQGRKQEIVSKLVKPRGRQDQDCFCSQLNRKMEHSATEPQENSEFVKIQNGIEKVDNDECGYKVKTWSTSTVIKVLVLDVEVNKYNTMKIYR